jgi:predicted phage-related endonuclease
VLTDDEETQAMRWGQILEPHIITEFALQTGRDCTPGGVLLQNEERPWQICTLDAMQDAASRETPGVLEVKATAYRAGDWTEGVPPHVYAQVQHQLAVTGCTWGSVAVLLHGSRLLWTDVERDEPFIAGLIEAEAEFWRALEAREPVGVDGTEATKRALKALYPRDTGESVALPGYLIERDAEREALLAEKKRIEFALAEVDAEIKLALGDASEGTLASGVTYTYRAQSRAEHVVKASTFRVLRRKESK